MPQDRFSQVTPSDLYAALESASPFQKEAAASGFVGIPVKWNLFLWDVPEKPLVVFRVSKEDMFALVSGMISSEDALLLSTAKQWDRLTVTGTVKAVSEHLIRLENLRITDLPDVSEDNSHPASKTKADVEDKEITTPPIHRQFTSTHLGSGVLVIVIAEVLLHDDVHTFGFKVILVLGILWLAYWVYAELLFRGKASRFLAAVSALGLILAASALAVLAYASPGTAQSKNRQLVLSSATPAISPAQQVVIDDTLNKTQKLLDRMNAKQTPSPTPTPLPSNLVYSHVTPKEMMDRLAAAPPYTERAEEGKLAGTAVEWNLKLSSVNPIGEDLRLAFDSDRAVIFVTIPDKGNEFLRPAKAGDLFTVKGVIKEISIGHAELNDYAVIVPGPAFQPTASPSKRRSHQ